MTVTVLARCVRGLEWVAAAEITARLPVDRPSLAARQVSFEVAELTADLLDLRTVDDAFVVVGAVDGVGTTRDVPPLLARRLAALDWAAALDRVRRLRPLPPRPAFDVVASLTGRNFNRYAVENAAGPALAAAFGGVHVARDGVHMAGAVPAPDRVDLTVRLFLDGGRADAALRLAARPLHRREYKVDTGAGTLHPPVAAALGRLAAPGAGAVVVDPFCGDGTIAIEVARGVPGVVVRASDLDDERLANARRNAARAGVELELTRADAWQRPWPESGIDAVITNPPWNRAVPVLGRGSRSLDGFWELLPKALTERGRVCVVVDAELDAPSRLRRFGYQVALASQIRLAGHVSHVVLAGPPGGAGPALPAELAGWRRRAVDAGVVTEDGW